MFLQKQRIKNKQVTGLKGNEKILYKHPVSLLRARIIKMCVAPLKFALKSGPRHCNYFSLISSGNKSNPQKLPNLNHSDIF